MTQLRRERHLVTYGATCAFLRWFSAAPAVTMLGCSGHDAGMPRLEKLPDLLLAQALGILHMHLHPAGPSGETAVGNAIPRLQHRATSLRSWDMNQPTFDPGLTQQYTGALRRSINKDGSFNVHRRGGSWRDVHPWRGVFVGFLPARWLTRRDCFCRVPPLHVPTPPENKAISISS